MMCAVGSFGDGGFRVKAGSGSSSSLKPPFKESDMTFEGVMAEYYFDTAVSSIRDEPGASLMKSGAVMMKGGSAVASAAAADGDADDSKTKDPSSFSEDSSIDDPLFWVRPSFAVCKPAMSDGETAHYLALGLHCKYDGSGIKKYGRPPLALSVVIDVSYSMHEPFKGSSKEEGDWRTRTKLEICKKSVISMLRHLQDSDLICISMFDQGSEVLIPLTAWKTANAEEIKSTIIAIKPGGATNLSLGFRTGAEPLVSLGDPRGSSSLPSVIKSARDYPMQKRVMFFTDMQPTMGETRSDGLFGLADSYASKGVYTTFVGVGLDFGSELANHITTNLRGATYLTVTSEQEFSDLMDTNFDFSVFPIISDLEMKLLNGDHMIEEVYGTRESSLSTATMMKTKTIFPGDENEEGHARGAILLIKLKDVSEDADGSSGAIAKQFRISLSYEDFMTGVRHCKDDILIDVPRSLFLSEGDERGKFESNGIRKAILIAEYVSICRKLVSKKGLDMSSLIVTKGTVGGGESGDADAGDDEAQSERAEKKRKVKAEIEYAERFLVWFEKESGQVGDESLSKETDVIQSVIDWKKRVFEYEPPKQESGGFMMGVRRLG